MKDKPGFDAAIFARDGRVCQYCGTTDAPSYHVDHVVPQARGGPSTLYNCVVACQPCNQRKCAQVWIPRNFAAITQDHAEWSQYVQHLMSSGTLGRMTAPPLHKTMISVTQPQAQWLDERAATLGVPRGEFLRRLIDQERGA